MKYDERITISRMKARKMAVAMRLSRFFVALISAFVPTRFFSVFMFETFNL